MSKRTAPLASTTWRTITACPGRTGRRNFTQSTRWRSTPVAAAIANIASSYLLIDGQRIVIAVSDPFQRGWDLFGTAFHEVSADWLPAGLVWTIQLAAVVGGHMLGAWAGHVVAALEAPEGRTTRSMRRRQIPLALVMVVLTTVTLWSLGQAIVVTPEARSTVPVAVESAAGSPIGHQGDDGSSSSPSSSASSTASRMLSEPSSR
jgi:hypothetical protein